VSDFIVTSVLALIATSAFDHWALLWGKFPTSTLHR